MRTSLLRSAAATTLAWGTCVATGRLAWTTLGGAVAVEDLVGGAVLAVGFAAALGLATGCTALTLVALLGWCGRTGAHLDRLATALTPALVRRALAVSVTTSLGLAAGAGLAHATEVDVGWTPTTSTTSAPLAPAPEPQPRDAGVRPPGPEHAAGPAPDGAGPQDLEGTGGAARPLGTEAAHRPSRAAAPSPAGADLPRTHVVRPGDSLWTVAAAHLPAGASDADVAVAWPRWHAANRAVVGPDPDLLLPGQTLREPDPAPTKERR